MTECGRDLTLIAEQCRGVSPLWFLLLTFLSSLSSCGVAPWPGAPLVPMELRGPSGVLGGDTTEGLQSKEKLCYNWLGELSQ